MLIIHVQVFILQVIKIILEHANDVDHIEKKMFSGQCSWLEDLSYKKKF